MPPESPTGPPQHEGHGWWPYIGPYGAFLLMSEIAGRLPESAAPVVLIAKPSLVLALIFWFRAHGAYSEWRGAGGRIGVVGGSLDVLVGLALTAIWVAPYLLFPVLRPEPGGEFDPGMAGEQFVGLILLVRLFGYAIVTPIFEELFIRSFVLRMADAWEVEDFRNLPIARYTARSMLISAVIFTAGHVPWEWWVCIPWIVLSNLWFYYRKSLTAIMLVHGVTNGSLLALAIWGGELFKNADGSAFSFWFFV